MSADPVSGAGSPCSAADGAVVVGVLGDLLGQEQPLEGQLDGRGALTVARRLEPVEELLVELGLAEGGQPVVDEPEGTGVFGMSGVQTVALVLAASVLVAGGTGLALVTRRGRGHQVGHALKMHQRRWALERGLSTITWTFDPLVARNAYFNLAKLGATPVHYYEDFYGELGDELGGDAPDPREAGTSDGHEQWLREQRPPHWG